LTRSRFVPAGRFSPAHSTNGDSPHGSNGRCRIYLVRHGQTVMNVEVRFRGRLDVPLNEQGRREAWLAAHDLADAGLVAAYTSPLCRAREVAEAIAEVTGVEVRELPGLINVDYGEWEGLTKEECAQRDPEEFRRYRELPEEAVCPGGEALADAADRVVDALVSLGRRHPGQAVAAVTHGAMVRLALLRVASPADGKWEVPLATGSATVFDVTADGLSLVSPTAALVNGAREGTPALPSGINGHSTFAGEPLVVTDASR
jgi:broad specificity phosphatase PhoE